jgi:hypothetical protein
MVYEPISSRSHENIRNNSRRLSFQPYWPLFALLLLATGTYASGFASYFYLDDMDWLFGAHSVSGFGNWLHWLFQRENEHLQPFNKIFIYISYKMFGCKYMPLQAVALAEFWCVLIVLWNISGRWLKTTEARCVLTGVIATSSLFAETITLFCATIFLLAFLFSLLALLGIEKIAEGNRFSGTSLAIIGSFLAPMSNLIGLPCGGCVLAYAILRLKIDRGWRWRDALMPGMWALCGTAGFIVFYLFVANDFLSPTALGPRGSFSDQVDLWMGLGFTFKALMRLQWGHLFLPLPIKGSGYAIAFASVLALWKYRKYYERRNLIFFLSWSFGFLAYVLICRSWAGPNVVLWGRYHIFPALGTAGILALATDGTILFARQNNMKWTISRNKSVPAIIISVLLLTNAATSASKIWNENVRPIRLYVKSFCEQWARFPGEYAQATGERVIRIPNVSFNIYTYVSPRSLWASTFLWEKHPDWKIEWMPATKPFDPKVVDFLTYHGDFRSVRFFLRDALYPNGRIPPPLD